MIFNDIALVSLKLLFLICITWVTFSAAQDEWIKRKRKMAIPLLIVGIALFYPLYETANDLMRPVVSSGKINLEKSDFEYVSELRQYRVEFPKYGNIEDVDVFYTAYYQNGVHTGRMTWIKYIDYRFDDDWIQTNHVLNNVEGQHTIVLKYRAWLWQYPTAKREAELSLTT